MSKNLVLVTAGGAKSGPSIIEELLKNKWPVRVLMHSNSRLAMEYKEGGCEVVIGDMFNSDDMHTAMKGVSRAYFLPPMHPYMIQCGAVFLEAAAAERVDHIVVLSQWLAHGVAPSLLSRQHFLVDNLFKITAASSPGMTYTIIRPG